jgi:hypothetical protein
MHYGYLAIQSHPHTKSRTVNTPDDFALSPNLQNQDGKQRVRIRYRETEA